MPNRTTKSPLFWSASVLGLALLFHHFLADDQADHPAASGLHLSHSETAVKGWLIKPFLVPTGHSGIALDGGELPLLTPKIPELRFGPESRRPLHLVLLLDWHSQPCRELLTLIHQVYRPDSARSLPSLTLTLLPIASTPESRETHEMMIRAYSMSGQTATFPTLVQSVSENPAPPRRESFEAFLTEFEPDLLERIRASPGIVDDAINSAFTAADLQLKRSAALFGVTHSPQLVAMHQILTTLPAEDQLKAFLAAAASYEEAYLSSPAGLAVIKPDFGCHCEDKSHPHQSWKAAILARFPELYSSPNAEFSLPGEAGRATVSGPQIRFPQPILTAANVPPGGTITHTVPFENIGDEVLEIGRIHLSVGTLTLTHWDRTVPPGSRGSLTIRYQNDTPPGSDQGRHTESIWVATNSVAITDSQLGDEVIVHFPVATSPPGPQASPVDP